MPGREYYFLNNLKDDNSNITWLHLNDVKMKSGRHERNLKYTAIYTY